MTQLNVEASIRAHEINAYYHGMRLLPSRLTMSTTDHQNSPLSKPDNTTVPEPNPGKEESDAALDLSSEVTKRVRLLGKLIIPPSTP